MDEIIMIKKERKKTNKQTTEKAEHIQKPKSKHRAYIQTNIIQENLTLIYIHKHDGQQKRA